MHSPFLPGVITHNCCEPLLHYLEQLHSDVDALFTCFFTLLRLRCNTYKCSTLSDFPQDDYPEQWSESKPENPVKRKKICEQLSHLKPEKDPSGNKGIGNNGKNVSWWNQLSSNKLNINLRQTTDVERRFRRKRYLLIDTLADATYTRKKCSQFMEEFDALSLLHVAR